MGTTTPNYDLFKPGSSDRVDVARDLAENLDKIDAHAHSGTYVSFAQLALNPDMLVSGAITRDRTVPPRSPPSSRPDGTVGTYTATTVSSVHPGAVDAYTITYGSPAPPAPTPSLPSLGTPTALSPTVPPSW